MAPTEKRGLFFWLATVSLVALLGNTIVGDGGVVELVKLSTERHAIGEDVFDLLRGNDELRLRIRSLRDSPRSLERLARRDLGLVRPGEIVYRFPQATNEPAEVSRADR